jgi:hypothetical protein
MEYAKLLAVEVLELIERDPGELKALYAPVLESIHFS